MSVGAEVKQDDILQDDILKQTFKRLKKKDADLSDVINTKCAECCKDKLKRVENIQITASEQYTRSTKDWNIYTHDDYPGLYVVSDVFTDDGLRQLLMCTLLKYPTGRYNSDVVKCSGAKDLQEIRSNLSCLDIQPDRGCTYWSGDPRLMDKLRWISLGYHYDWTLREYRTGFCSTLPFELKDIASNIVKRLSICEDLQADAAIVNYYHAGDTLSFHTDELEWDLTKPLVSISLGLGGILCVGGTTRHAATLPLLLNSGDVVILSGASRTAYHAVPRVLRSCQTHNCQHCVSRSTCVSGGVCTGRCGVLGGLKRCRDVLELCDNSLSREQFYRDVVQFLSRTRINVSIRQVQKFG